MTIVQMPPPPPGGYNQRNAQETVNWVLVDNGVDVIILEETNAQVCSKHNITEYDTEQEALDYIYQQGLIYNPEE